MFSQGILNISDRFLPPQNLFQVARMCIYVYRIRRNEIFSMYDRCQSIEKFVERDNEVCEER